MVGIGGAGMSALAAVLLDMGVEVSGSDLKESSYTRRLREAGARIHIGHEAENVDGAEMVVYSSAIREGNVELRRARERGLEIIPRADLLARLMREKEGLAVAGTHGKTTTTSMLAKILCDAGQDPTCIVGGELNDMGSNARIGRGRHLVAEADESDGSFLYLEPWGVIVTNIEQDHHDFYGSPEQLEDYFHRFLRRIREGGAAVLNGDDGRVRKVAEGLPAEVSFFGMGPGNRYRFDRVELRAGGGSCRLLEDEVPLGEMELKVPGLHNLYNAVAAAAMSLRQGIDFETVRSSLAGFSGVHRRYELVGECRGIRLLDDYAHHPTEVASTLEAARCEGASRLVCIFQPHRYSRTAALGRELGEALGAADLVILTEVYGAGEDPIPGVNAKLVLDALLESHPRCAAVFVPKRLELGSAALRHLREGDLVLTMGAGDVTQCSREILESLAAAG
jgi:UDP-N-acetylmuramate--alanine ligase